MYTYNEILKQAEKLDKTFQIVNKQNFQDLESDMFLFIGCGTSFYLAASAARYFQAVTGKLATALPASEVFMHPEQSILDRKNYQVIAISRSGTTSEIIKALQFLQTRSNVKTLSVTCYMESPMARISDSSIVLDHIKEKSVVMTQSFSNMLYAIQIYAAKLGLSGKDLRELEEIPFLSSRLLKEWEATRVVADNLSYKRFIFLGSGIYNGIAKEATLKLKEMTQTECESYSNLEFRHGPISIVDDSTIVIMMSQTKSEEYNQSLVEDIQRLNGSVLAIGQFSQQFSADHVIRFKDTLSERSRMVLFLPHLQLLAYHRAIKLGYNPDQPRNLSQVVKLNFS